jgi:peptidoglycan/LPS O-acetylase OafA/YrhL
MAPVALLYILFGAGSQIGLMMFLPATLGMLVGWVSRRKLSPWFLVITGSLGTALFVVGIAQLGADHGDTTADEVVFLPLGLLLILIASTAAAVTAGSSLRRLQDGNWADGSAADG